MIYRICMDYVLVIHLLDASSLIRNVNMKDYSRGNLISIMNYGQQSFINLFHVVVIHLLDASSLIRNVNMKDYSRGNLISIMNYGQQSFINLFHITINL